MQTFTGILFFLIFISSCRQNRFSTVEKPVKNQKKDLIHPASVNYDSSKKDVQNVRYLLQANTAFNKQKTETAFLNCIVNKIIPAWIGTKWTFSGTSEIPGEGSIACGYFVTTVLRDAGVKLNRVKLAQAASEEMIQSIVQKNYISRYSNIPLDEFVSALKITGPGLYIIGLDNHTGFIYVNDNSVAFIHSSFIGKSGVQYEDVTVNSILNASKYRVVGKLSADEQVLRNWIKN